MSYSRPQKVGIRTQFGLCSCSALVYVLGSEDGHVETFWLLLLALGLADHKTLTWVGGAVGLWRVQR